MMTPEAETIAVDDKPTFEKVWAWFQKSQEDSDRRKEEDERRRKEDERRRKEDDRRREEADLRMQKLEKQMQKTDKLIGDLGNRFGELAEHMVAPSIMEKFNELGFHFTERLADYEITEPGTPEVYTEIDLLLGNDDIAIAVEVKAKPKQADVDKQLWRMEILRRRADQHNDSRKLQGAIAGAIMPKEVHEYALRQGLYTIVQTGDTVRIDIPDGFKPREW